MRSTKTRLTVVRRARAIVRTRRAVREGSLTLSRTGLSAAATTALWSSSPHRGARHERVAIESVTPPLDADPTDTGNDLRGRSPSAPPGACARRRPRLSRTRTENAECPRWPQGWERTWRDRVVIATFRTARGTRACVLSVLPVAGLAAAASRPDDPTAFRFPTRNGRETRILTFDEIEERMLADPPTASAT